MMVELEIKTLLDELGNPGAVAERVIDMIEKSEDGLDAEQITALCRFLLHAGLYTPLISFTLRHIHNTDFKIPWPYFLEAIALSRPQIDDVLADELLKGIDETSARTDASRSKALDVHAPELKAERADRRLQAVKTYRREKENMLEQLVTLRTQQLFEQEKLVLEKLRKMYPEDPEVLKEVRNHKDRYALDVLAKHSRLSQKMRMEELGRDPAMDALKPAFAEALRSTAEKNPELAADLVIAAAMLELWEDALYLMQFCDFDERMQWLHLELLRASGRFLELLQELTQVEMQQSSDPETFFATAYLRAQALWGLGQKHAAIEVMESLLAARPQYRSGLSLLSQWRGQ